MDFLELAKERFSCRKFSSREVEQEKIDKIIKSALYAPTAVNMQPFKIFQIQKEEDIEKLKKITPYTFDAKLFLVVGADAKSSFIRKFDNKNFAEIDAAIAATHIMLEVHDLGLGTTWVGYFDDNALKDCFPQMKEYDVVAIFPIGYPANDVQISSKHYASKTIDDILEIVK